MILLGYLLCISYVLGLIFLVGPCVKKYSNVETSRKAIHILLFVVWILIDLFLKDTVHQIIVPVIFVILNALSYKFRFYKSVEREEGNHFGTVYFAVAITVLLSVAYIYPEFYMPGGIAIFCLTFGDGFAALVGYNFKSRKLLGNKSLLGFFACGAAAFLSVLVFCLVYQIPLGLWSILLIAAVAAITELVGSGLDNFSVSFSTGLLSCFLISDASPLLRWGVSLAVGIFLLVFFAKSIDYWGALLAAVMVFAFTYFGNAVGITYFLLAYFTIFAVSLVKKLRKEKKKSSIRTFRQILINGGLGTLFVVLYGCTADVRHLLLSIIAIGGCFVDSVASDVGAFSKVQAYDYLKKTPVSNGLSGGVTPLGSGAALAASLLIGLYTYCFVTPRLLLCLLVAAMCMLQTTVDTLLGSLVQVKYRCPACGQISEKKTHCNTATTYHSGICRIDNNAVNALSSLITTLVACLLILAF